MTNPGLQAHQAAHQTHQADSRRAGQSATLAGLRLGRRYQRARARDAASASLAHGAGSAAIRMIGRLIRFVVALAIIGAALGVLALVLKQAEPSLYHQAVTWLKHLL
jgi:hypothetical protein